MGYAGSAEFALDVTWERCVRELRRHGLGDARSLTDFALDVWVIHASGDTIPASRLLDWLGH